MNKNTFKTKKQAPITDTVNEAGGKAYTTSAKHALMQMITTSTFSDQYYKDGKEQLKQVIELCNDVYLEDNSAEFIAKAAIYSRNEGFMKDSPVVLLAFISTLGESGRELFRTTFSHVIDNGKMIRNLCQVIRSGVVGRKNFGHLIRNCIQNWFDNSSAEYIFKASVGNDPSLADVIKMLHIKPNSPEKATLYGYLIGRDVEKNTLPKLVQDFEAFKSGTNEVTPAVPFQMLTGLPLKAENWKSIAEHAGWQMIRMNLNTFARHGILQDTELVKKLAARLSNKDEVIKARQFPYQMYMAFLETSENPQVPMALQLALQDALDHSLDNVPDFGGKTVVFADCSGSMHSPITGYRGSGTSKVEAVDVCAMMAAAVVKKNPDSLFLPFDDKLYTNLKVNPRDSIATIAKQMPSISGGTDYSLGIRYLNEKGIKAKNLIWISDMQSWCDSKLTYGCSATQGEWEKFRRNNPEARAIHINLQSGTTVQSKDETHKVLNIGGWSDAMWDVIADWCKGGNTKDWVSEVQKIQLGATKFVV